MYLKEVPKIRWFVLVLLCIIAGVVIYLDNNKDAVLMLVLPIAYGFDSIMMYDPQDKSDFY